MVETEGGVVELTVDDYVRNFTSAIISKMMFGNNYHEGMKLFPKCKALINAVDSPTMLDGMLFSRYKVSRNFLMSDVKNTIYFIT